MTASGTPVFTHAEDERLAAALLSVVRRPDFDAARLDPWLARFVALEKQVWSKAPPDPPTLDASQNARNLLRSLYVLLSQPPPSGTAGQSATAASDASAQAGADRRREAGRERGSTEKVLSRRWPRSGGSPVIPRELR